MSAERIGRAARAKAEVISSDVLPWLQGQACEASKFHSPTPLLVRPLHLSDAVALIALEGTTLLREDTVYMCSTCTDNLTVYLSLLYAYNGLMPNMLRRDFGNSIRDLGDRAWDHNLKRSVLTPV